MKKQISLTIAGTMLLTSASSFSKNHLTPTHRTNNPQRNVAAARDTDARASLAISESEALAFQYIMASAIAAEQGAALVKVDQNIRDKYDRIAKSFGYSVPMTAVGGGLSLYFGPQAVKTSAEFAGPLLQWVKPALQMSWDGLKFSGRQIDAVWRLLKLDKMAEFSSDQIESSYKVFVQPILRLLVNKNTSILSGASASSGLLYASIKFTSNNSSEAMTWDMMRSVLGQDDAIHARIQKLVESLAPFLGLEQSAKAALEIAVYDEILKQAVDNNFTDDESKYNLDLVKVMTDNNLIDKPTASALLKLRDLAATLDYKSANSLTTKSIIQSNVQNAITMAAVLESNLTTQKITDAKLAASMQRQLGLLNSQLALINMNRETTK